MLNSQLRELIDACRSTDDLTQPEMAELAEAIDRDPAVRAVLDRSLRFDRDVAAAMDSVEVPEALRDRLMAGLQAAADAPRAAAGESAMDLALADSEPREAELQRPATREKRIDRRLAAWLTAGIVASLAGVWIVTIVLRGNEDLDRNQLASQCANWIRGLNVEGWRQGSPPLDIYPIDSAVTQFHDAWQTTRVLSDSRAVVYTGATLNQSAVFLFVIPSDRGSTFPNMPPLSPVQATGGYSVGVWKSKGCIYVLAVKGGPRTYRSALKQAEFALRPGPARSSPPA